MNWLIENWFVLFAAFAVLAFASVEVFLYFKMPKQNQVNNIKEWLKYAVAEAEKKLGAKTGQLKLRLVYDMAVQKFPWIINLVSFNTFSGWVDDALEWLNKQMESNEATQNYISGE